MHWRQFGSDGDVVMDEDAGDADDSGGRVRDEVGKTWFRSGGRVMLYENRGKEFVKADINNMAPSQLSV